MVNWWEKLIPEVELLVNKFQVLFVFSCIIVHTVMQECKLYNMGASNPDLAYAEMRDQGSNLCIEQANVIQAESGTAWVTPSWHTSLQNSNNSK